jgi:hypothetical protein
MGGAPSRQQPMRAFASQRTTNRQDMMSSVMEAAPEAERSDQPARVRLPAHDPLVPIVVAALAVIALPFTYFPSATPRMLVVLCALPLGLAALGDGIRRRDRATLVGSAFVLVALISALLAEARWMSVLGSYGRDTSALVVAAGFGLWATGRRFGGSRQELVVKTLLACLLLSFLVGCMQIAFRAHNNLFGVVGGRAHGLAGGHVYFGATMAAGACLACVARPIRSWSWYGFVLLFAAGANLSGSRFPLVLGFVVGLGLLAVRRDVRSLISWIATYAAGFACSSIVLTLVPGIETASDRAGQESAGRLEAWRYAWSSLWDRPLFGWGPTGFRSAVQGRFTADFTAHHAQDELSQIWFDAHNVIVGTAISFGLVGLALATWFGVLAARRARGPLGVFTAVVMATWLVEPAGLSTFPLAMLTLGAAMAGPAALATVESTDAVAPAHSESAGGQRRRRLLLLVGVALAAIYLLGDIRIDTATARHDPDQMAEAAAWAPWDPVAANVTAAAYANFIGDEPALREARRWMERAHARQPDFPFYLNKIAQLSLILGEPDRALEALAEAQSLQEWNVQSLQLLYVAGDVTNDEAVLDDARSRLCQMGPQFCP